MDLVEVAFLVQRGMINSSKFPFRKGGLKDNFLDIGVQSNNNNLSFTVLSNPKIKYGKILQERASINYRTKNSTIRHKNRHFRYIDRIVEEDILSQIENAYGVRRI